MRFDAVFKNRKTYGADRCCNISHDAVWCGFQKLEFLRFGLVRFSQIVKPTVQFGAVFTSRKTYGAVRCGFQMS